MDPFAVFGLAPGFALDASALRKKLLRLQRGMHPDYFGGADESQRELAIRNTAELNAAFEILADAVRRADWLVQSLGGPGENEERQMPQAFLMEVMEWNEMLEEARESEPGSPAREAATKLGATLDDERGRLVRSIEAGLTPLPENRPERLVEVRRALNAVRYLDRALEQIEEIRLESASSDA